MPKICALPPDVAAKIAAGEVVERPASVVKELVENAIDAGASVITIEVDNGGCTRIAVTDDGCGMEADDACRAFDRYATSKITAEEDLWHLATMGFRGEALHAIAAVSTVVIETRTGEALEGTRVECASGAKPDVRVAGCPRGTRIDVRDLFHATPARKKFLKSAGAEFGHVSAEVLRTALAHPSIAFNLSHNGKKVWSCPAVTDERERMRLLASHDEMERFVAFDEEFEGMRVCGWVGDDMITRASAKHCHVFVNRRPVRDRLLMHGVTAGYGAVLERGRYPVAAVFVEIDPQTVDVNVHPTKREVRFENGPAVHDVVQAAVNKALGRARQQKAFGEVAWEKSISPELMAREARRGDLGFSVCHSDRSGGLPAGRQGLPLHAVHPVSSIEHPGSALHAVQRSTINDNRSTLRVLSQFNKAFILCEDADGTLVVIDQHAAHERLGFEELTRQYRAGKIEKQQLLFPQTMTFTPEEIAAFEEARELFERAGFEAEHFGGNDIIVKAMPAILGDADVKPLFEKIFTEFSELGSSTAIDEKLSHMFSVIACHRQVRAGDHLSTPEMQRLVDDIVREKVDACPHGRPAIIRFSRRDINGWFKRT